MIKIKVVLLTTTMFLPFIMNLLTENANASSSVKASREQNLFEKKMSAAEEILPTFKSYRMENIKKKVEVIQNKPNTYYWALDSQYDESLSNLDKLAYFAKFDSETLRDLMDNIVKSIVDIIKKDFVEESKTQHNLRFDHYLTSVKVKTKSKILSLFNGRTVGEYLYQRINNSSDFPGNTKALENEFARVLKNVMQNLKQIKVELKGTTQSLGNVLRTIAKGTSSKEYDFIHDMKCYLEQFWYVCNGKDKNGEIVRSVVSRINDLGRDMNGNFVYKSALSDTRIGQNKDVGAPPPINDNSNSSKKILNNNELKQLVEDHIDKYGNKVKGVGIRNIFPEQIEQLIKIYEKDGNADKANIVKTYNILANDASADRCGFANQGTTCFLNSALHGLISQTQFLLRLLSHVSRRYNELFKCANKNPEDNKKVKFVLAFIRTVCHVFMNPKAKEYAPIELYNSLTDIYPFYKDSQNGGDSQGVLGYIMQILHEVLTFDSNNAPNIASPTSSSTDRYRTFYNFYSDFCSKDNSVIKDYFYSIEESCEKFHDNYSSSSFQAQYSSFYPLIEVFEHRYKYNLLNGQHSTNEKKYFCNTNPVSLQDCFQYSMCEKKIKGYCKVCDSQKGKPNMHNFTRREQFASGAKVIPIVLNRGKGLQFPVRIKIPQYLDNFGTYCTIDKNPLYYLSSVVCFAGDGSGQSGHYTVFSKPDINSSWFWFNDNLKYNLSNNNNFSTRDWFLNMLNGQPVEWFPYILFYTRIDNVPKNAPQQNNNNIINNTTHKSNNAVNQNDFANLSLEEQQMCRESIINFNKETASNIQYIKNLITNSDKKDHTLGIQNIGSTCYLNATLQVLANIIPLREFFIKGYYKQCREEKLNDPAGKMVKALAQLIAEASQNEIVNKNSCVNPQAFKNSLDQATVEFRNLAANDATDLMRYLLETIDNVYQDQKIFETIPFNQSNETSVLNYHIKQDGPFNSSIIRKLLWSHMLTKSECCGCNGNIYNMQVFQYLNLPMSGLKDFAKKDDICIKNKKVTICDLIRRNGLPAKLTGDNQYMCNMQCHKLQDALTTSCIYYGAPILIISLDHGKNKQYTNQASELQIPLVINLNDNVKHGDAEYFLSEVIIHSGESGPSGHFVSWARTTPTSDWYEYNDSTVTKLTEKGVWKSKQAILGGNNNLKAVAGRYTITGAIYQKMELYDDKAEINKETIPVPQINVQNNNYQNIGNQNNNFNPNNAGNNGRPNIPPRQNSNQMKIVCPTNPISNNSNIQIKINNSSQNNMNNLGRNNINYRNNMLIGNQFSLNQMPQQTSQQMQSYPNQPQQFCNQSNQQQYNNGAQMTNNNQNNMNNLGNNNINYRNSMPINQQVPPYPNRQQPQQFYNRNNQQQYNNGAQMANNNQNNMNEFNKNISNNKQSINGNNKFDSGMTNNIETDEKKLMKALLLSTREQKIKQSNGNSTILQTHALRALANIGATCYMNATLQCLLHIIPFVGKLLWMTHNNEDFVKKAPGGQFDTSAKRIVKVLEKYRLARSFTRLALNVYDFRPEVALSPASSINAKGDFNLEFSENRIKKVIFENANNQYYKPYDFKETISDINPLFKGAQANDAHDLINTIIMTLHQELNKAKKVENSNTLQINQTDKKEVFSNYLKSFEQENKSIISDLFYGTENNAFKCLGCNIEKCNYQTFFSIILPLEEVRRNVINVLNDNISKYPILNQNMNYQLKLQQANANKINIYDCFDYYTKTDWYVGKNAFYCNKCNRSCNAYSQKRLTVGPEVLILVLNRGKGVTFKVQCQFPETLDLQKYIEHPEYGYQYRLVGVITHMGGSDSSGHFVATCRESDGSYSRYNDELVYLITNLQSEVINYAMPYILFYQKINNLELCL